MRVHTYISIHCHAINSWISFSSISCSEENADPGTAACLSGEAFNELFNTQSEPLVLLRPHRKRLGFLKVGGSL